MSEILFDTWEESVRIDTDLAAIRWKAGQRQDQVRSRHSEDRMTWIVYRTLEQEALLPQFCTDVLHLPTTGRVSTYYWQRLPNGERIDADIDAALAEVEPCHTARGRQRTETDLILLADDWLCMCEHKLGNPKSEPEGWRQGKDSPLVEEYEQFFRALLKEPDRWHEYGLRFAQLVKNISLGVTLTRLWGGLDLHLAVVVSELVRGENDDTYFSEFDTLSDALSCRAGQLHLVTWQRIRGWLGRRDEPLCRLACEALDENNWL